MLRPAVFSVPRLLHPTGTTVKVSPGQSIADAVNKAASGTTILLADGTYDVSDDAAWFNKPRNHVALGQW